MASDHRASRALHALPTLPSAARVMATHVGLDRLEVVRAFDTGVPRGSYLVGADHRQQIASCAGESRTLQISATLGVRG